MAQLRKLPSLVLFAVVLAFLALAALAQGDVPSELSAVWATVAVAFGGLLVSAISSAKARWFPPPDPVADSLRQQLRALEGSKEDMRETLAERERALIANIQDGAAAQIAMLRKQLDEQRIDFSSREVRYLRRVGELEDRVRTLDRIIAGRPKSEERQYDTDTDAVSPNEQEEVRSHSGIQATTWTLEDTGSTLAVR